MLGVGLLLIAQALGCNRFLEFTRDPDTQARVISRLQDLRVGVVFAPGLFDRWVNRGAFVDELKILRESGVEAICTQCSGTAWNSQGSVAVNAQAIGSLARSLQSKGGVILVGHSRGGKDIFNALITENAPIRGAILMQAPLAGTPVADWFFALGPMIRNSAYAGLVATGGHPDMLYDLTTGGAAFFNAQNDARIRAVLNQFPVIAYSTTLEPGQAPPLKSALTYPALLQVAGPNDGMIPFFSASAAFHTPNLWERDFIRISERGISHVQIAGNSQISTWGLLREILDRME